MSFISILISLLNLQQVAPCEDARLPLQLVPIKYKPFNKSILTTLKTSRLYCDSFKDHVLSRGAFVLAELL